MKLLIKLFDAMMRIPPVVLSAVAIGGMLWLTLAPDPLPDDTPSLFEGADKVAHFLMFGVIAALLALDVYRIKGSRYAWMAGAVASGVLGGLIEIVQGAMGAGRSADWADWVADVAGAVVGAMLMKYMARRRNYTLNKTADD
ncbi:MAG: VanZ family protein [Paramuribaculum sp.]|nr:VanZ family protein [Paramuribaculum sp.]